MKTSDLSPGALKVVAQLNAQYPDKTIFRKKEVDAVGDSLNLKYNEYASCLLSKDNKVSRGVYDLTAQILPFKTNDQIADPASPLKMVSIIDEQRNFVEKDETFVKWGAYSDILKIVKSNSFFPTYIAGLSGNGKTVMVEQACANIKRECIRVNLTQETDEDDLIGGFRLINGETVFSKGPVIKAMENGSVLLLDEIDRATNKIMCLQGVLEGKPIIIKKTGEVIKPAAGFNVIGTANTKGKGSDESRFTGASVLDDAFLERFTVLIEQAFPTPSAEKKIVINHMQKFDAVDEDFADHLVKWADIIRKTYYDDGIDEIVSTRRLCHIVKTFSIFKDKMKAIKMCINRFDEDTNTAFLDLYSKVDASVEAEEVDPQAFMNSSTEEDQNNEEGAL